MKQEQSMNPKVSFIMGVYNGANTLNLSIDSIINQTFKEWELIICDDCSTDKSLSILNDYAQKDQRIKVLSNKKNIGLAATLNKCIKNSSTPILARQDADDTSHKERLEKQYKYLLKNPDISILGTNSYLTDDYKIWGTLDRPEIPSQRDWLKGSQVIHASTLMKKDALLEVGCYNEKALRVEDTEMWYRLISRGHKIRTLQEKLYYIEWSLNDYKRKSKKARLTEIFYLYKSFKNIKLPPWKYFYLLRPLITLVLPNVFLYYFHNRKFKDKTAP